MKYQVECELCPATCWVRGKEEPDGAVIFDENDPMEDACEHIQAGGDFFIIDEEEHFDED